MSNLQGGPAQPVYIISDSDLVENGGKFKVVGKVAIPLQGGVSPDDAAWLATAADGGALGTAAYEDTDAFVADGDALTVANNLSDLDTVATARTNLGLDQFYTPQSVSDAGASLTLNPNVYQAVKAYLTENCTISITAPTVGDVRTFYFESTQDLTGGWSITWPSNVHFDGETTPSPTTTAGTSILYSVSTFDGGTNWYVKIIATTSLLLRILDTGPAAFLPMTETSGTTITDATGNGRSGVATSDVSGWTTYTSGPLGNALAFGSNRAINLLNFGGTDFASCCDWDEYSIMFFAKVSGAGVWTDSTTRYACYMTSANGVGGVQRAYHPRRTITDNQLGVRYYMNGNGDAQVLHTTSTTDWMQHVVTISKSANSGAGEVRWYIGNDQIGATQALAESWTETNLNLAVIGAGNTTGTTGPWSGWIQGFAVWNKILTATDRARLLYA